MLGTFTALILFSMATVKAEIDSSRHTLKLPSSLVTSTVNCTADACGEHVFLTPYLKSNRAADGKKAAVTQLLPGLDSYSGYLTVDDRYDSNMFFWFFPSEKIDNDIPLILWLAGGPGGASTTAAFVENGPLILDDHLNVSSNANNWAKGMNLLYIDNPVGAGFSFTKSSLGYTNDEVAVGKNLYEAMSQFFQLFPEYLKNDFFIIGESAAGKFVPALGYTIHRNNPSASTKINLKGIAIGNGWVDPVNQMGYSDYLYNLGLIDNDTKSKFVEIESQIRQLIENESYVAATTAWLGYLSGGPLGLLTNFWNETGIKSTQNYLETSVQVFSSYDNAVKYLNSPKIRKLIHVGDEPFWPSNTTVLQDFLNDMAQSVAPWLEVLLDHYRVLIYNGQLDVICPYPLAINFVRQLKWQGAAEYAEAKRHQWHVGGEVAGYAKSAQGFTEILVRNAGHCVTADKPLWARDMVKRFTKNLPFETTT